MQKTEAFYFTGVGNMGAGAAAAVDALPDGYVAVVKVGHGQVPLDNGVHIIGLFW